MFFKGFLFLVVGCGGLGGLGGGWDCLRFARLSLLLAAGALPKFESVFDTTFSLYMVVCEQVHTTIYTKEALQTQGFQTSGGRWDSNPRPSEPQSVTLTD